MKITFLMPEGLIIAKFKKEYAVEDTTGNIIQCSARTKQATTVCGDKVIWKQTDNDCGVITEIKPRKSLLSRPDSRGKAKTIAANIDQIIIVCTAQVDEESITINTDMIDRYLVAAENINIEPVILINKIDLLDNTKLAQTKNRFEHYHAIGYCVLYTSAKKELGLDNLVTQLTNKTSIFVGESGVGKSSLINELLPDKELCSGALSSATGLGKHTTTTTMLYNLPQGGRLIDSPGVREFGLWNVDAEQLEYGFREFRDYQGQCKFRDCKHLNEPGCAVEAAVGNGKISEERLKSYRKILLSLNN